MHFTTQKALHYCTTLFEKDKMASSWIIHGNLSLGQAFLNQLVVELLTSPRNENPLSPTVIAHQIAKRTYGNLLYIAPQEGEKDLMVDDFSGFEKFMHHSATFPGLRIVVVDNLNIMNRFTANSMLKTLEEPPKNTFLFLLASYLGSILPTIRSRCQILTLTDNQGSGEDPLLHELSKELMTLTLKGDFNRIQILCEQHIKGEKNKYDDLGTCFLNGLYDYILEKKQDDLAEHWLSLSSFWYEAPLRNLDPQHAFLTLLACLHDPQLLSV